MPWWPSAAGGSSSGLRARTTSPARSPKTYRSGCWMPDSGGGRCAAPATKQRCMSSTFPPSSDRTRHGCVTRRNPRRRRRRIALIGQKAPPDILGRSLLRKGSGGGALLGRLALRTDPTKFDALATGQVRHADPYRCWADHDAPVHLPSVHLPFTYCTTDGYGATGFLAGL